MQFAGTTSWRMATDEPQSLLMALYVRDASGLRPQVDPDVTRVVPLDGATDLLLVAA
jgi:hypothetical protein